MEMTILLWYQMLGWFLQLSRKWQYLCMSLVCWRTFCKARKKIKWFEAFFVFKYASTSRHISKMKFCSSFINVKTLEQIPPGPFFPRREKSTGLQERDCVLGGSFQTPFLCGGTGRTSHLPSRKRSIGKMRGLKLGRMKVERKPVSEKMIHWIYDDKLLLIRQDIMPHYL